MREAKRASDSGRGQTLVTTHEGLARFAEPLDALLAQSGAPASARLGVIQTWFRHRPGQAPWCVLLPAGGEVLAAAVLCRSTRAGRHVIKKAGEPGEPSWLATAHPHLAVSLAQAMGRALDSLQQPWVLNVADLPERDPVVAALGGVLRFSSTVLSAQVPRLYFVPGRPLKHYVSCNTRSVVNRALGRITAAGLSSELAWTRDPARIGECLPDLLDVHRRRNHQLRGSSLLDQPNEAALFVDTLLEHARSHRLRLLTLRLDGSLAAFAICLEGAGGLWVYANLASPDWLAFSPGTVVNAEVVRAAHADPAINCLDWGAGLQRYKLSGEVTVDRFQDLRAWSSRSNRLAWMGLQWSRRALRRWRLRRARARS
jgi:Acetyltransferase (GNAT) domain